METGSITTFYPFPFYEVEATTPTRYYLVNGQAVAFRTGTGSVTYLTRDQVGSVVMATANGSLVQQKKYYPYGNGRGGGDFSVDFNYTGQRKDGTGLLYYNARYYDPQLGQFLSPDSIIPDPTDYFSYNRYLYVRGNPISNNDPSGHITCCPTGLSNPLTWLSAQATRSFAESDAAKALGFIFCTMTMCDLPEMLQEGHSYLRENYVDPHLPGSYLQTEETLNTILSDPLIQEVLMGAVSSAPLRFGQASISARFTSPARGSTFPYAGWRMEDVTAGLKAGSISPNELPVQFIEREGVHYAINNRSLKALRTAGLEPTQLVDITGDVYYERELTKRLREAERLGVNLDDILIRPER